MVNISDVGYLRSFSNHEGCPIHPNWIRWTKAMNNQTHRKSVRERLEEGRWFKNGVYYMCCALVWPHQWLTEQCIFYLLWCYFAVYFPSLSWTDFRWVRSTLARTNSLHRIRSSLFASIFYPPPPVNLLPLVALIKAPCAYFRFRSRYDSIRLRVRATDSSRVYWTCAEHALIT